MTADEWAGEEYRQQRRKGCGRSAAVIVLIVVALVWMLTGCGVPATPDSLQPQRRDEGHYVYSWCAVGTPGFRLFYGGRDSIAVVADSRCDRG